MDDRYPYLDNIDQVTTHLLTEISIGLNSQIIQPCISPGSMCTLFRAGTGQPSTVNGCYSYCIQSIS